MVSAMDHFYARVEGLENPQHPRPVHGLKLKLDDGYGQVIFDSLAFKGLFQWLGETGG
jgi:hypothetical protein